MNSMGMMAAMQPVPAMAPPMIMPQTNMPWQTSMIGGMPGRTMPRPEALASRQGKKMDAKDAFAIPDEYAAASPSAEADASVEGQEEAADGSAAWNAEAAEFVPGGVTAMPSLTGLVD